MTVEHYHSPAHKTRDAGGSQGTLVQRRVLLTSLLGNWMKCVEPRGKLPEAQFSGETGQTQNDGPNLSCQCIGGKRDKATYESNK